MAMGSFILHQSLFFGQIFGIFDPLSLRGHRKVDIGVVFGTLCLQKTGAEIGEFLT